MIENGGGHDDQGDLTLGSEPLLVGGADDEHRHAPYRPDGLAEHLLGQNDRGTIDRLLTAYNGARTELAKGGSTTIKAADMKFDWGDGMKGLIGADDPVLKAFTEIAERSGFGQEHLNAIPKFFDLAVEKGWIEQPFDSGRLLESLAPAEFKGTPQEKQAKGGERLTATESWIGQLTVQQGFDDAMKQELRLLTTSAAGVKVVELLMTGGMVQSFSLGGDGGGYGGITKADLDKRLADPRNDSQGAQFNEAFAQETRNLFRRMYPE